MNRIAALWVVASLIATAPALAAGSDKAEKAANPAKAEKIVKEDVPHPQDAHKDEKKEEKPSY